MPAYNKEKRQLFNRIEQLATVGMYNKDYIIFEMERITGFSRRTITEFIDGCLERGVFIEECGVIKRGSDLEAKSDG